MTNKCDIDEIKHQIQEKFLTVADKLVWQFPDEAPDGSTAYLSFMRNYYRAVSGEWEIGDNGSLRFANEVIYSRPAVSISGLKYSKTDRYTLLKPSQVVFNKRKAEIDALPIPTAIKAVFDKRKAEKEQVRCEALQAKLTSKLTPGTAVITGKSPSPWWKFW